MVIAAILLLVLVALVVLWVVAGTDMSQKVDFDVAGLGMSVNGLTAFVLGVVCTLVALLALWMLMFGSKRGVQRRRERKELRRRLDRAEDERAAALKASRDTDRSATSDEDAAEPTGRRWGRKDRDTGGADEPVRQTDEPRRTPDRVAGPGQGQVQPGPGQGQVQPGPGQGQAYPAQPGPGQGQVPPGPGQGQVPPGPGQPGQGQFPPGPGQAPPPGPGQGQVPPGQPRR